ncbi:putative methyltransferase DDB_G0268948 [Conger conger]|uniref:putative methyltransferase DDB_G0268948 n=1 Tax=Conger conger TaxID=82655 RepID=UPI002A5ACC56|nr:putative methyltransferase DDB_G0268948 [Conger conger]
MLNTDVVTAAEILAKERVLIPRGRSLRHAPVGFVTEGSVTERGKVYRERQHHFRHGNMAHRLFEDRNHAAAYQKYRISPSQSLIAKIVDFLEEKKGRPFDLAVDVGCGSGQGTVLLAPHFSRVIGMDISRAQLEMAEASGSVPNVSYRQSSAEELPLTDGSVDLVTAMAAAHWFDVPRFLQEVDRVLKPRGCLGLLSYTMDMELQYGDEACSQKLNRVCQEFYAALRPFRNPCLGPCSMTLYKQISDSITYPEKEWNDCMLIKHQATLGDYMGMVESFSSFQGLLKKDPEEARRLSQDIRDKLRAVMGTTSDATQVVMGVKYFCVLACKP